MGGFAVELDKEPVRAIGVGDDPDLDLLRIEDRTLLDMELEIGIGNEPARGRGSTIADALELAAEGRPVVGRPLVHPLHGIFPGEAA